jgi:hypothetical protein
LRFILFKYLLTEIPTASIKTDDDVVKLPFSSDLQQDSNVTIYGIDRLTVWIVLVDRETLYRVERSINNRCAVDNDRVRLGRRFCDSR